MTPNDALLYPSISQNQKSLLLQHMGTEAETYCQNSQNESPRNIQA